MYQEKIDSLLKVFQEADEETSRFMHSSGLKCEQGCGRCCESPYIEATVFEMLPVAFDVWRRNEASPLLEKLAHSDVAVSGRCVFYRPDPFVAGHGRCSVYHFRPLVCRLFGFSAAVNKHNRNILMTCNTIKRNFPEKYEPTHIDVHSGQMPIARMRDFSMKALAIDLDFGDKKFPINQALKIALEKVGLMLSYRGEKI